jgi:hypothetical protein
VLISAHHDKRSAPQPAEQCTEQRPRASTASWLQVLIQSECLWCNGLPLPKKCTLLHLLHTRSLTYHAGMLTYARSDTTYTLHARSSHNIQECHASRHDHVGVKCLGRLVQGSKMPPINLGDKGIEGHCMMIQLHLVQWSDRCMHACHGPNVSAHVRAPAAVLYILLLNTHAASRGHHMHPRHIAVQVLVVSTIFR